MQAVKTCTRILALVFVGVFLNACKEQQAAGPELYLAVDDLYEKVVAGTDGYEVIAKIDHSRLAAKEGEVMPPARVIIFSDPWINTPLLKQEPLTGLDLPFRVLAYAEGDSPALIYTTADYLKRRHGLADGPTLKRYEESIQSIVSAVPEDAITPFDTSSMAKNEGIATLNSIYGFEQSIKRLQNDIMAEGDTIWFGEIDYQAEAAELGITLPKLTLLLFGAPGPGAKAMADIPRMGLDAFCQKILVHELADGSVRAYFNEMPAFAELHEGAVALPHRVIKHRMGNTLSGAIEE
jgi:uncharacterized protein (DUF302 family)